MMVNILYFEWVIIWVYDDRYMEQKKGGIRRNIQIDPNSSADIQ